MSGADSDVLEQSLRIVGAEPGDEDAALDLSSLQVVMLVEELETTLGARLAAREVTREHFRTRATLRALLRSKGLVA